MSIISVLSILYFSLVLGNGYTADSNQAQADYYLSNIRTETASTFNLWGLIKLAESSDRIEKYIIDQTSGIAQNSTLSFNTQCLLEVFELFQDNSPTNNKSDRLFHAYQCTDDNDFLIITLYELDPSIRMAWYIDRSKYFNSELFTPAQNALINKSLGRIYSPDDLFSVRRFRLSDIYTFDNYTHDSSTNLSNFFNNWLSQLSNMRRSSPLLSDILATTLITGYFRINQYDKIMDLYLSHSGFEAYPNSRAKINTFRRVSYAAYYSGYYQTNLQLFREHLIPLTRLIGDHQDFLIAQFDYGNSLFQLDNYASALKEWEQVYNDSIGIIENRYQSGLLNNLAISYLKTGNFDEYIQLQINALRKSEEVDDYERQLFYLNNLYIYHRRNSNWDVAFSYLNQALEISSKIQIPEEIATILRSLGTYYREVENDYDKALFNLMQAEVIADTTGFHLLKQSVNTEIALTYQMLGRYDDALEIYYNIAEQSILRDDYSSYIDPIIEIASILLETNDLNKIEDHISVIRAIDGKNVDFNLHVRATNVLARYEIALGKYTQALTLLTGYADQILERMKNSAEFQSGYLRMDPEFQQSFQLLTDVLIHENKPARALAWLDEIKNISKATYYNNSLLKSSILTEEEMLRDFVLGNRIERLRNELLTAGSGERAGINLQLSEAINERNRFKNKVLRNIGEEKLNIPRMQRILGRNELVLSFSLFDNILYKSTISAGNIEFEKIVFSDEEMSRVEFLIESVSNNQSDLHDLHWLYEKLFEKPFHARYTKLYVIPDGFLFRVPLEILPVESVGNSYSFGSARYMIEDYSISYLNSVLDLENQYYRTMISNHSSDFSGFGVTGFNKMIQTPYGMRELPPLPYAEFEVEEISSVMTNLALINTITGHESTEQNFRKYAADSRILHIASHSEVFHNDPLFSLIYLQSGDDDDDSNNDGLIYAYELFELNLRNEMVMLSSCESGSGSYVQGSGIIGLSRAFTYAGAQSMVMNLWQIRDQTASEIAVSFYTYLNRGMNKDEAMQKAKIDYINNNNSDPYLWGSYVVYGDVRPIVQKQRYFSYMILGLILVVMFRFTVQAIHNEEGVV